MSQKFREGEHHQDPGQELHGKYLTATEHLHLHCLASEQALTRLSAVYFSECCQSSVITSDLLNV